MTGTTAVGAAMAEYRPDFALHLGDVVGPGSLATVVEKTGIEREKGWLYYLDKQGDVIDAEAS